jgi:hypothetical protein
MSGQAKGSHSSMAAARAPSVNLLLPADEQQCLDDIEACLSNDLMNDHRQRRWFQEFEGGL